MTTMTPTDLEPLSDDWQRYAVCRDQSQLFYEENERLAVQRGRTAHARELCGRCPVLSFCAAYALRRHEEHGIWGGLTEADRHHLYTIGWEDLADPVRNTVDVSAIEDRLRDFRRSRRMEFAQGSQ